MGTGSLRNRPCWCGSGKKYKRCHERREREEPIIPGQRFGQLQDRFSKKYCLAFDAPHECSGDIVRAHTLQRQGAISEISEDGHVLGLNFHPSVLSRTNGWPEMRSVGQKSASTFTGFCAHHDNSLFAAVEDESFEASREQCLLLHYRAACRELFQKSAMAASVDLFQDADRGRQPVDQFLIQNHVSGLFEGTQSGLSSMAARKAHLDELLVDGQYDTVRALVLWLCQPPPLMSAGGIFPDEDFDGEPLQDLSRTDFTAEFMGFTLAASGGNGFSVLTWIQGQGSTAEAVATSLASRSPDEIVNLLAVFAFEYLENTLCRPSWWNGLSENSQKRLLAGSLTGAPYVPSRRGTRLSTGGFTMVMPALRDLQWIGGAPEQAAVRSDVS